MNPSPKNIKAIALISSGLDSLLAAKIVNDGGVDVRGICFYFQFDKMAEKNRSGEVQALVQQIDIPLDMVDITEEFMPILLHPQHGYGSGVNPCIDCHVFMLRKAAERMEKIDAQFLVTGEVVGQRPMSQMKPTLFRIDKISGLKGLVLRPLSAKLLPPTLAEDKGWIDRERLYDMSGRSRTRQMELARRLGIVRYNTPAGGCILTDPNFARRAKALFAHKEKNRITVDDLKLLRLGRHFWPQDRLWIIVGRNEEENQVLEELSGGRWMFRAADTIKSPLVLAEGLKSEQDRELVAGITVRYIGGDKTVRKKVHYIGDGMEGDILISPESDDRLVNWRV